MITRERELELMDEAIAEAACSKAEDDRVHPKVGALLVHNETGEILHRSHRGEDGDGGHAEYNIFNKAEEAGIDLSSTALFVTLEPCTRRGLKKIPCAVRIAASGVKKIYIGTLDPNSHITGRGEVYLSNSLEVERFTSTHQKKLAALNSDFFAKHAHDHIPVVSPYAGGENIARFEAKLASQRDGLLQQSMDLISGTSGDVCIFAGDLTWLKELQICLLLAKLDGRNIKVLCDPTEAVTEIAKQNREIASKLGMDICVSRKPLGIRGPMIIEKSATSMIAIERTPALHGHLFRSPHDSGILTGFQTLFQELWLDTDKVSGTAPVVQGISELQLASTLKKFVPSYTNADIYLRKISPESCVRLSTSLERFKIFRLHQLELLREKHKLPSAAIINGSPWPIKPPVVEEHGNQLIVFDGTHRIFSAISRGQQEIEVLVVKGVTDPLPCKPLNGWDELKILNQKLPREERYRDFKPELFRPIREAFTHVSHEFNLT